MYHLHEPRFKPLVTNIPKGSQWFRCSICRGAKNHICDFDVYNNQYMTLPYLSHCKICLRYFEPIYVLQDYA